MCAIIEIIVCGWGQTSRPQVRPAGSRVVLARCARSGGPPPAAARPVTPSPRPGGRGGPPEAPARGLEGATRALKGSGAHKPMAIGQKRLQAAFLHWSTGEAPAWPGWRSHGCRCDGSGAQPGGLGAQPPAQEPPAGGGRDALGGVKPTPLGGRCFDGW